MANNDEWVDTLFPVSDLRNVKHFSAKLNFDKMNKSLQNLHYQTLAIKIVVFIYMTRVQLYSDIGYFANLIFLPYCFMEADHMIDRLWTIANVNLSVIISYYLNPKISYVLVLANAIIYESDFEFVMDGFLFTFAAINFVYHIVSGKWPRLVHIIFIVFTIFLVKRLISVGYFPHENVFRLAVVVMIYAYASSRKLRELGKVHLPCALLMWVKFTYFDWTAVQL